MFKINIPRNFETKTISVKIDDKLNYEDNEINDKYKEWKQTLKHRVNKVLRDKEPINVKIKENTTKNKITGI